MYEVNRSVFILIPQEPFWLWLQSLPGLSSENISLTDLQEGANAYLVAAGDSAAEIKANIAEQYQAIFTAELADWCEDETLWPEIDLATFSEWFSFRIGVVLTDLAKEALMRETFSTLKLN